MRTLTIWLFTIIFIGTYTNTWAQKPPTTKSPKKLEQEAQEYEKAGDFYRAAVYYETAWTLKEDKLQYAYNAGRCYLKTRDYANAAKCLESVKDKNDQYDKPGFKYALALKQTGQYEEAKQAFNAFLNTYNGKDDALEVKERVETEIQGCNYALKAQEYTDPNVFIEHLDENINTDKTEYAPIPFNNNVLYFSSTKNHTSSIYRTQKSDGQWITAQSPSLFVGKMELPHYGNGTFTPDGKRFYFTQCDIIDGETLCGIYVMSESNGEWSKPEKLPDYINVENFTTTHPYVTIENDQEVLYFASDRDGGKGGLDLWYCTRAVDSRGNNFTLPKNLGMNINTPGDEITPYYHKSSETLYFSSNGRISAGGFDIFKTKGSKLKWEVSQNLGFPVNSEADDLYYIISEAHGGGYFSSNRRFDPNKVATTNDDIFHFVGEKIVEVAIQGLVYDNDDPSKTPLSDINIKLFAMEDGVEEMVKDKMLASGDYKFTLEPNTEYLVEISKPASDYNVATYTINTGDFSESETVTKNVAMVIPVVEVDLKEILHKIVPPEYDSEDNPYTLPYDPPIDPVTGEPYAEGTPVHQMFLRVASTADMGDDRKVYYNTPEKDDVVAWFDKTVAVTDPPVNNDPDPVGDDPHKNFEEDAYNEEAPEIRYKVQVAAVRYYKESRYEELYEIDGTRIEFEPIDGGVTRVLIIPEEADENGRTGFRSKGEALDILTHVFNHTKFDRAFAIKYVNEMQEGDAFRGWEEESDED